MESKEYYISLITSHTEELRKEFGVKSLRLFGSVSEMSRKWEATLIFVWT